MPEHRDAPYFQDFRNLVYIIWKHIGLPKPTPVQYDIAHYMQTSPERAAIHAWRGEGKSYLAAAYSAFELGRDPENTKVMVVSAGHQLAGDFTKFVLSLIETIPELQWLKPSRKQRQSGHSFDVGPASAAKDPSMFAVGVFGQMTGHRGTLIIPDDIETPRTSETVSQREKLLERSREFDAIVTPGGKILYLGTPQVQDTTYASLPERGYDVRIWPVIHPTPSQRQTYGEHLAPFVAEKLDEDPESAGSPVDPIRFPLVEIEKRRIAYGPAGFALQFMLDPSLSDTDKYPLKQRDLLLEHIDPTAVPQKLIWSPQNERHEEGLPNVGLRGDRLYRALVLPGDDKERLPLQGITMSIDPSGRGSDETGYAIGAALNGYSFLLDAGGVPGVSDADLDHLCLLCRRWNVTTIVAEPNYGGGMFKQLMTSALQRNGVQLTVEDSAWASGRKEKRIIEALYPVVAGHRLVVNTQLFQKDADSVSHLTVDQGIHYRLWYQFTHLSHLPGSLKHDDRLEAVAILVTHLAEQMSVEVDRSNRERIEQEWDEMIEDILQQGVKKTNHRQLRQ
jgi:hypothetical protein